VEAQEEKLQLADDDVLVVSRVADQRPTLAVSRQVAVAVLVLPEQQLDPARLLVVQERVVVRPGAVDGVEVEARRAEVVQAVRVVLSLQAGDRVEGDVMVDELAEVGVVRLDLRVVRSRGPGRRSPMRTHAVSSSR